ncbi:MAG: GH92 family glycosyl hydrolase [Chitinophagaceae bacterium]
MKKMFFAHLLILSLCISRLYAQTDYAGKVNPFIGTGGHGHTYPGSSMPFGMMQLSPDTRLEGWDGCSGYHYSDKKIYGFSHTHLSGTGIPDYCDILFMPYTGNVEWEQEKYASPFSHSREKAAPGYYEVMLEKHRILARLTTSYRSGMHEYQFPKGTRTGSVLIDLVHRDPVLDAFIEQVSDTELRGYRRSKFWARDQTVYFYIRFEKPILDMALQGEDEMGQKRHLKANRKDIRARFSFDLGWTAKIRAAVGISGVSMEGAKRNLDTEIPGWDFEKVRLDAKKAWNRELGKISVEGGTPNQQTIFYTALYHTMLSPNIYTDVDGQYRGTDLKVHKAEGFTNYTVFSLWDTYRAFHPLMSVINRERTLDWIKTFLAQYQNGGMLPVWELSGNETFCMIGYHSVPVIADAWQKGIRDFDTKLALEAMRSYAESDRFGLKQYAEKGFLSNETEHESVSKTLEYAYDDWCIARFAGWTGDSAVYHRYMERTQNYKNLFDPATNHMRGKLQGMWYGPFDPREVNNFFTEGNSWQYSFAVPQDIGGLALLMGGQNKFADKLEELFTASSKLTGRDQADVTGLIGQYAHGNEPSHHMAYLFNYAARPWRTQELVHKICSEFYTNAPDGLIGNEDCGQMSAWYVLSAMGIYPVCPGDGRYTLGTPQFDRVTIRLENGKIFTLSRKGKPGEFYVQGAMLNGKAYTKLFINHGDIAEGGALEFMTGPLPSKNRGVLPWDMPAFSIRTKEFVAVPFVDMSSNKFRKETQVRLSSIELGAKIYYRIMRPDIRSVFVPYEEPFAIRENTQVDVYAEKDGQRSPVVTQHFFRMPDDRTIRVLSEVHPMYTAGGPEALVDGVVGTTNWRTGEWQSYYDRDFEAIVDLQEERMVDSAGVHVLQDVSPWILYPRELIVLASADGKEFLETGRIQNLKPSVEGPAETQVLLVPVRKKTRYLKIRAMNGGKLPDWHESAGSPSHLFIDEVILK